MKDGPYSERDLHQIVSGNGEDGADRSIRLIEQALSETPDDPALHHWYGVALQWSDPWRSAMEFARSVELAPGDAGRLLLSAHWLVVIGQLDMADSYISEAIRLRPDDRIVVAGARHICGQLRLAQRRQDDAEVEFRAAVELDPDEARYVRDLVRLLRDRDQAPEAMLRLREAIDRVDNPDVLWDL